MGGQFQATRTTMVSQIFVEIVALKGRPSILSSIRSYHLLGEEHCVAAKTNEDEDLVERRYVNSSLGSSSWLVINPLFLF